MSAYIVDASVIIQYAVTQTYTPEARVLVAQMYEGDVLAIYDSLYIALAQSLDLPLITVDERQSVAATASGIIVKPISDFSVSS